MDPNAPLDIRFSCPECDAELLLPRESPVTEGPCPRCRAHIRAPQPPRSVLPPPRRAPERSGSHRYLNTPLDEVLTPDEGW